MKKILFVNHFALNSGVERVMEDIIFNLSKDNFEITIFNFLKDENFDKVYSSNINYMYEFNIDPNAWTYLGSKEIFEIINSREKEILKKLNDKNFDIVIAMQEGLPAKFVSKLECKNKFAWIHINYLFSNHTEAVFDKKEELECMKKFQKVVCVSRGTKEAFIKKIGDSGNLCVRYNPVDNNKIIEKSKKEIDFSFPKDTINFITVGRLAEQKGYDRLISAANKLLEKGLKFNLYIIGDGKRSYKEYLMNKVKFNENIHFLGNIENPFPYLIRANCFICSSIWEAHGVAVQEAIVLHLPIIMTNYLGADEAFESGKAGIIVDNSEEGIYNGMLEILKNNKLLTKYRKYLEKDTYIKVEERIKAILELFEKCDK